jgi:hypothetical protein
VLEVGVLRVSRLRRERVLAKVALQARGVHQAGVDVMKVSAVS